MNTQNLCRKYNVNLITEQELFRLVPSLSRMDNSKNAHVITCNSYESIKVFIGDKLSPIEKEIALWHEIGHTEHPFGDRANGTELTAELAANTWLLKNYDGFISKQDIIQFLREYIMYYIKAGCIVALNKADIKETAIILGIDNLITWIE